MSQENDEVYKAYYSANSSFFLRSWQYNTRRVDVSLHWNQYHDSISQLINLFIEMNPLERGRLIYQLLLISKKSIIRKTIIIYTRFIGPLTNNEEPNILPRDFTKADKDSLIFALSHSPLSRTRRIFSLHQQLEMQIVEYFQQMLNQMTLSIDLELKRLLYEMMYPLVQDVAFKVDIFTAVEISNEDYDSDATWNLDRDDEDSDDAEDDAEDDADADAEADEVNDENHDSESDLDASYEILPYHSLYQNHESDLDASYEILPYPSPRQR